MHAVRDRGILDADRRGWSVLVGTVLAIGALVPMANANTRSLPFDDAYISFSYAARLATGHGLRLSVGAPPVEAFSDPLWVAMLALGKLFGVAIPTWARVLNIALIATIGGGTARLVRRLSPEAPAWMAVGTAALVVFVPATTYDAVGGLETLLFAALLVVVLLCFLSDWTERRALSVATTVGCLLLAVTRPEGAVVWAVLWAQTWIWSRSLRRQALGAAWFVLPMFGLELARLAYFGQPIPNSIVTKAGTSAETTKLLIRGEVLRFTTAYLPVLILAAVVVVVVLVARRWTSPILVLTPVVVVLALVEAALSSGDNYPYERYLLPLLAPMAAIGVAGISRMAWATKPSGDARDRYRMQLRAGCVVVVLVILVGTFVTADRHQQVGTTTANEFALGRGLTAIPQLFAQDRLSDHGDNYQYGVAEIVDQLGQPHQVLATDEVGAVSYYTDLRIVDLYGLADRHIAERPGPPGTRIDPAYVFAQSPAFFAFRLTGCLCVALANDAVYLRDPRIFAYRLVAFVPDVIPDYVPVPPAAVIQRDPSVIRVTSLDRALPAGDHTLGVLPASIATLLSPDPKMTKTTRATAAQTAAAPLALRVTFTVVTTGTDVAVALPARTGSHCDVEVTALSPGGGPQAMTLSITDRSGATIARTAVESSSTPDVRTVTVAIPDNGIDPMVHLDVAPPPSGPGTAQWAEPRMICRSGSSG